MSQGAEHGVLGEPCPWETLVHERPAVSVSASLPTVYSWLCSADPCQEPTTWAVQLRPLGRGGGGGDSQAPGLPVGVGWRWGWGRPLHIRRSHRRRQENQSQRTRQKLGPARTADVLAIWMGPISGGWREGPGVPCVTGCIPPPESRTWVEMAFIYKMRPHSCSLLWQLHGVGTGCPSPSANPHTIIRWSKGNQAVQAPGHAEKEVWSCVMFLPKPALPPPGSPPGLLCWPPRPPAGDDGARQSCRLANERTPPPP